jgi:diaminohydroxyphosphoribosylaminopyrimidine deaminase/5-amino-6-(5-phosphoribosylamino)uracil reductase
MSADGYLDDGGPGPGLRISGPLTSLITHQLRRQQAAILVGARTLIQDDPDLRAWRLGEPHPRVIVASDGRPISGPYQALSRKPEPLVVNWPKPSSPQELVNSWFRELMQHGLNSLLVEGGRQTLDVFLQSGVWDEIHVFQDPALNLHRGTPAPLPPCQPAKEEKVGKDIYRVYYPKP